jgi:hypothetical protein
MEPWEQIEQALLQVRDRVFRMGMTGRYHIAKARDALGDPALFKRYVEPFENDVQADEYRRSLPALIEQTRELDARCASLWQARPADPLGSLLPYYAERDRLAELFLRFRFPLRSYERLVRQSSKPLLQDARRLLDEVPQRPAAVRSLELLLRLSLAAFVALEEEIAAELRLLDGLRAAVVAAYRARAAEKAAEIDGADPGAVRYALCGLQRAAVYYDPRRGYSFWVYAEHWVEESVRKKKTWGIEEASESPSAEDG